MHQHYHVTSYNRAFIIGIVLNLGFVIIEFSYGLLAQSLALVSDAWHNLSDVFSLFLAWGANILSTKTAPHKYTYGYGKVTILASLASSVLLLIALGGIAWEAIERLMNPQPIAGMIVIIVAIIGVIINTLTALLFVSGQKQDLNIRGAFLHMAADAGVSLGVAISGIVILMTNWLYIDPITSLLVVAVILVGTWSLLRASTSLALDSVPDNVDIKAVKAYLNSIENVVQIEDLHVWAMNTTEVALTVQLTVTDSPKDLLHTIRQQLKQEFQIWHSTIQIELLSEKTLADDSLNGD